MKAVPSIKAGILSRKEEMKGEDMDIFSKVVLEQTISEGFHARPFLRDKRGDDNDGGRLRAVNLPDFFDDGHVSLKSRPSQAFLHSQIVDPRIQDDYFGSQRACQAVIDAPEQVARGLASGSQVEASQRGKPGFPGTFPFSQPEFHGGGAQEQHGGMGIQPGVAFVLPVFFQQGALFRGIGQGMDSQMVTVGVFGAPDGA